MSTAKAHPSPKFRIEKTAHGGLTLLELQGVVDESFEGEKVAASLRTNKLILSLREVRRFASWGMAEWMNFLRATAQRDLYLIECSTYAVNQINLVTGLLGHGKLVSFYSPYRCAACSEEFQMLRLVPQDRAIIREIGEGVESCTTCGGIARMDKYPAAMCTAIAERPAFDIDDEVLAFLRSRFQYDLHPDATRFRAHRRLGKGHSYLRLTGNMATLPGEQIAAATDGITLVDLAGVLVDLSGVPPWRTYLQAAQARSAVTAVQLVDCPPGFLETAISPEDLRGKLKVRTFAQVYSCATCSTTTAQLVDVAENLEQLIEGGIPSAHCATCKLELAPVLSPQGAALLRMLPARERDAVLDKFLAKARSEPIDKLEDCLVARSLEPVVASAKGSRALYIAIALGVLAVVALGAIAVSVWLRKPEEAAPVARIDEGSVVAPRPAQTFQRPDWIVSDVPSSAYCHDMINRLMCVGVSSYRPTRGEAVVEANDAALEELVSAIGLKISEGTFKTAILPGYSEARNKALSALQTADTDRKSAAYATADEAVKKARKRVVESLKLSGGAAVPSQRTDWYWEEYAVEGAARAGTETLVFVRYDVALDAVRVLVENYSATTPVLGSSVMTAFPALAWERADATGAIVTKVGKPLASTGIAPMQIVSTVDDQPVHDAAAFAKTVEAAKKGSTLKLGVTAKDGDGPKVVELQR